MGAGKKKPWWIIAILSAAAVIAVVSGKDKTPVVDVRHPERCSITRTATAFGRIRAVHQVTIAPDVSGEITGIFFEEGDTVKKGDLLVKIKQETYQTAIERGNASLSRAIKARDAQSSQTKLKRLEYERCRTLYGKDATCLMQLQQAQIEMETAIAKEQECEWLIAEQQAALKSARSELSKTLVYSPMDGVVTSVKVKEGERVVGTGTMAGTEMMTIADMEHMELVVDIGENDICTVKVGDRAEIKPDAALGRILNGKVEKIALCASAGHQMSSTTDFEVRISIENQDDIHLLPGMSAQTVIITGSKNDILTVPLQAVTVKEGREIVLTVDPERRICPVTVSCGIQDFSRIEICSGLEETDLIVTGPIGMIAGGLSKGDKVKTRE